MNYYPHHIGDYTRDTAHLSMLEDCAYRRLLDIYYATERPLPRNQQELYRLVRARSHAEKLAVDIVIGEFFLETDSGWRNKRADEEILKSKEKTDKARESANMRWHPPSIANAMRTHSEGNAPNNQKPITNNQKPDKDNSRKRAVSLPPGFSVSERVKTWAEGKGYQRLDEHLEHFVGWARASGKSYADWDQAFMNAVRDDWAKLRANGSTPDYSSVIAGLKD